MSARRAAATPLAVAALLAAAIFALAGGADAATRLFIVNHVASNDVRAVTAWGSRLALATQGGLVLADPSSGATTKVLHASGGLPSNNLLALTPSPAGLLWIGTADRGLARMRPDGTFLRTLTSFDGLPSDRVQALFRSGDSVWVATSGGVALFTENPANAQFTLRRSDSSASTAGGIVSDDVTSLVSWGDTLWAGTDEGLSSFTTGAWTARTTVAATRVQALLVERDSLWIGTKTGLRVYAGGAVSSRGLVVETLALASIPQGVGRGTTIGPYVEMADGSEPSLDIGGLPTARVQCLLAPPGVLVAGTNAGLARYDGGGTPWTPILSQGPASNGGSKASANASGLWITLGNGAPPGLGIGTILRYDGAAWSTLTDASTSGNLQSAGTIGVLASRDGRVWFGHCCADAPGDSRPRTDRWDPVADVWDRPAAYNLDAITQAPSGRVYGMGVEHENGVYVFDGATATLLDSLTPVNSALTENNLRGAAFDAAGRGWFATAGSGVDRWNGNGTDDHSDDVWSHFQTGFPSAQTTSVGAVSTSDVWVGTQGGVVRIANDAIDIVRSAAVNAVIAGAAVTDLAVDSHQGVWVGSIAGLVRVSPTGSIEHFDEEDGLAANDVRSLSWDEGRGVLWALTAGGVSEIHVGFANEPSFDDGTYLYPNPVTVATAPVRLGGLSGEIRGEVRDTAGGRIRSFTANPASTAAWDLRDDSGTVVAPGLYLVVLRQGDITRVLRVAVVR